jgi:hypothetical protein
VAVTSNRFGSLHINLCGDGGIERTGMLLQTWELVPTGNPEFGLSQRLCGQSPVNPACTTRTKKSAIVEISAVCGITPGLKHSSLFAVLT